MVRADGHRDRELPEHTHGYFVPSDDIVWTYLDKDRHAVFLFRLRPGNVRRTRFFIGELRRTVRPGTKNKCWRAFPEGETEFPELFANHFQALEHLKQRWEMHEVLQARPQKIRRVKKQDAKSKSAPDAWVKFFGEDPFS